MTQFWLSFCDPDAPTGEQFLGVSIVEAAGALAAVHEAHMQGCNPGGEVQIVELQGIFPVPDHWTRRLLDKTQAEALNAEMQRRTCQ